MTTTRHYSDVQLGEIVHAHGVPLVVTSEPTTAPSPNAIGGEVTWFGATYRGPEWDPSQGQGLLPFVCRDGDTWTFQRATPIAKLVSWDDGQTWHQRP